MSDEPALREVSQSELDSLLDQHTKSLRSYTERPSLANLFINGLAIPEGYKFTSADLSGTRFHKVDLDGCEFNNANLENTDFRSCRIKNCHFVSCENLKGTIFPSDEEIRNSKFEFVHFAGCTLHEKDFLDCTFHVVKFIGARLEYLTFLRCKFHNCTFAGAANINSIDFGGARLTGCDAHGADFSTCENFILDATDARELRLPVRSSDRWSQMVRSYTGANMLFNLLFLAAFFSPLIVKGIGLIALGHIEARLMQRVSATAAKLSGPSAQALPSPADICAAIHCKAVPVWRALLGPETSMWVWGVGLVLLAYNAIRAFLTWRIAPLKDEQQTSAKTPAYLPDFQLAWVRLQDSPKKRLEYLRKFILELWDSYAPFWWLHRVISIVFWFTIILSVFHLVQFFRETVYLPG